ncbi:DUF167 domain-containing protein [Leptospira fletcheri]|uniref:UPF0235 protein EHO60_11055 n=1 Tax=Leptospira fletcheri TaxID=2484981 RepID=A0A4V3JDH1_9LEPT|nr:DUF167 domain-containing protein [Leptospira fletcheri]TGK09899.1 DUF167 domain-containing protein [Leptospira fletcheri]
MRIEVKVKPNSKKTFVRQEDDGIWTVAVSEPAIEGKANEAVIKALAREFDVPKRSVRLLHGEKGKNKLIEISRESSV